MNWKFWQRKTKSNFVAEEFSDVKIDSDIDKAAAAYRNLQRECAGELDWRSFLAGWNERIKALEAENAQLKRMYDARVN